VNSALVEETEAETLAWFVPDCEAERSFSVTPRHLLTNSCGVSLAIPRGCYQPPKVLLPSEHFD
jgi:hypothetical protein